MTNSRVISCHYCHYRLLEKTPKTTLLLVMMTGDGDLCVSKLSLSRCEEPHYATYYTGYAQLGETNFALSE